MSEFGLIDFTGAVLMVFQFVFGVSCILFSLGEEEKQTGLTMLLNSFFIMSLFMLGRLVSG